MRRKSSLLRMDGVELDPNQRMPFSSSSRLIDWAGDKMSKTEFVSSILVFSDFDGGIEILFFFFFFFEYCIG